ncbi:MAG: glycine cleavage system protein GcvH [Lentisphaeria bacterium]|nr:glycine cleavage system protein GcvH [Lentisphaeria bacterium]NQZ69327.1 glycine cleavage system protein GcvH [Lentisphaeria bacterium]
MKHYTKEHEWVEIQDDMALVGITEHAADELGDITFIELPDTNTALEKSESFGVVESVKAASDLYSPIAGDVSEVNEALDDNPELVNEDAEGEGWIIKLSDFNTEDLEDLMDEAAYKEFIG